MNHEQEQAALKARETSRETEVLSNGRFGRAYGDKGMPVKGMGMDVETSANDLSTPQNSDVIVVTKDMGTPQAGTY